MNSYRFWHWFFQWQSDDEGDLTFVIAGVIGFTKYKEHTVFRWFPKYKAALKWQGLRKE